MLISEDWYKKHKKDHTREEIDQLGIEVSCDGRRYPEIKHGERKGMIKCLLELNSGVAG
jgi:hypothetical protein